MALQFKKLTLALILLTLTLDARRNQKIVSKAVLGADTISTTDIPAVDIRVLLDEIDTEHKKFFTIATKENLTVRTKNQNGHQKYHLRIPSINLAVKHNTLYVLSQENVFKKLATTELELEAPKPIFLNDKQYRGTILLTLRNQKLYVVNKVNLEDYVYGLLFSESYQFWPHRMQKVQAIVSRTYAIHHILEQRKSKIKKPYDIKNSTLHQRYDGYHNFHHLRRAVDETKGIIITYRNEAILAMFDACCGGNIPALMSGLNFNKAPYLARTTPCNYCKNYHLYRWHREISTNTFLDSLYNYAPTATRLSHKHKLLDIQITNRDKSGMVRNMVLQQPHHKTVCISGKELWMSMPDIVKSQKFTISKESHCVVINGKGFGHQVGLCQRGARELVSRGWSVKKILAFYYPNTTLSRLKVNDTLKGTYAKLSRPPRRGTRHLSARLTHRRQTKSRHA